MRTLKKRIYPFYRLLKDRKSLISLLYFLKKTEGNYKNNDSDFRKTIIINSVQISALKQFRIETLFLKILVLRGNRVIILYCDGVLSHCDRITYPDLENDMVCSSCKIKSRIIARNSKNFTLINYSSLLSIKLQESLKLEGEKLANQFINKEIDSIIYNNFDITSNVNGSIIRYIHDGSSFIDNRINSYISSSITNSLLSIEIAKEIDKKYNPDIILSLHAIMASWGAFIEYFKKKNLKIVIYGKGQTSNNSMVFFNYNKKPVKDMSYGWEINSKRELTHLETNMLKEYLENRFNRTHGFTSYIKTTINQDSASGNIRFDNYHILFPNVPWDNSLSDSESIFTNALNWIFETVQWFIDNPTYNLVIRAHPSEAKHQTSRRTLLQLLNEKINNFSSYKNFHYIHSDESVSSYDLLKKAQAVLVYNGTLGLEATYLSKPVIFGGNPTYKRESGLLFPISKREYFTFIENQKVINAHNSNNRGVLIRFLYFLFFQFEIEMPFLDKDNWFSFNDMKAIEVLKDHKNNQLNFFFNCIESDNNDFSEWRDYIVNENS